MGLIILLWALAGLYVYFCTEWVQNDSKLFWLWFVLLGPGLWLLALMGLFMTRGGDNDNG